MYSAWSRAPLVILSLSADSLSSSRLRCVYLTSGNSAAVCWKPWTDHECVHSQMTVPACPAYCSRLRLWPRPPTDRKQESGTGSRHSRSRHGAERTGRTDKRADGRAPLYLCRLFQRCRRDAVIKKKKN